jgi:hypothetical protein
VFKPEIEMNLQQRLANKIRTMRADRTKPRSGYRKDTVIRHIMRDCQTMSSEEMAPLYAAFIADHPALYSTILLTKDRDFPHESFQIILDARMDPTVTPEQVEELTNRVMLALAPSAMPNTYDPHAEYPLTNAIREYNATGIASDVIPPYLLVKMQENPFTDDQLGLLHKLLFLQAEVVAGRMKQADADNIYSTENARIHDPRLLFQDNTG